MSHQPIYLPAMREARAREVAQDYPGALTLWREAAAQLPEDSRERIYCTAQAAQCERVLAKLPVEAPAENAPDARELLAAAQRQVRPVSQHVLIDVSSVEGEKQHVIAGDSEGEGTACAFTWHEAWGKATEEADTLRASLARETERREQIEQRFTLSAAPASPPPQLLSNKSLNSESTSMLTDLVAARKAESAVRSHRCGVCGREGDHSQSGCPAESAEPPDRRCELCAQCPKCCTCESGEFENGTPYCHCDDEPPAAQPEPIKWRVGNRVPLNVYRGDEPICQCHTPEQAREIVAAMNAAQPESAGESQSVIPDDSIYQHARGNLAFLLSAVACGESLQEDEIANVRKVIHALTDEQQSVAQLRAELARERERRSQIEQRLNDSESQWSAAYKATAERATQELDALRARAEIAEGQVRDLAAHVRERADSAWAIYKGKAEESDTLKRGDPYTEGRADAYSEISGMLHTENAK